jgi:hypothetical protein
MTLGELRQFLASIENLPDESPIKTRVTLRRRLREVTVEDDDSGFRDYVRAVSSSDESAGDDAGKRSRSKSDASSV